MFSSLKEEMVPNKAVVEVLEDAFQSISLKVLNPSVNHNKATFGMAPLMYQEVCQVLSMNDSNQPLQDKMEQYSQANATQDTLVSFVLHAQLEHSNMVSHMQAVNLASINQKTHTITKRHKIKPHAVTNATSGKALMSIKNA